MGQMIAGVLAGVIFYVLFIYFVCHGVWVVWSTKEEIREEKVGKAMDRYQDYLDRTVRECQKETDYHQVALARAQAWGIDQMRNPESMKKYQDALAAYNKKWGANEKF